MSGRYLTSIALCALAVLDAPARAQTVQYRSPTGIDYRSQVDTGPVARANQALAADPRSVERFIELGVAQSGARQFREAIETFSRGLAVAPNDPMLYRWRGHRYLSLRDFDRARDDLTRGFALDSTNYGILYHLGVVRYALGDFDAAADAFRRAQPRAPNAGELAGATDWLWMSLARAGRLTEANAMLDRRPDSLPATNAYAQRLRLYRGEIAPEAVMTAADTTDVAVATLAYGIGNWYFLRGDTTRAREWFERSVKSGGWPAFGFITAELELNTGGLKSRIHRHPGPEAWLTLSGQICLETPDGRMIGRAGGDPVVVRGGPAMELSATGSEVRKSLALVLHDSSMPASVLAPDWRPRGLCGST